MRSGSRSRAPPRPSRRERAGAPGRLSSRLARRAPAHPSSGATSGCERAGAAGGGRSAASASAAPDVWRLAQSLLFFAFFFRLRYRRDGRPRQLVRRLRRGRRSEGPRRTDAARGIWRVPGAAVVVPDAQQKRTSRAGMMWTLLCVCGHRGWILGSRSLLVISASARPVSRARNREAMLF